MPRSLTKPVQIGLILSVMLACVDAAAQPVGASDPASPSDASTERASETRSDGLDSDRIYTVLVAELAARRGDLKTAFTHYLEAAGLTRDPRLAELAVRAAISGKDDPAAAEGLRRWLELDPTSSSAHQVGALMRINAGDQEGALIHLMRIIALSKDDPDEAFAQAAAIVSRAPSSESRVGLMQALVAQFPDNAYAHQSLAMVAASASLVEIADDAARRAIELRPEWNKPRLFLVKLLLSADRRDEARALLEDYLDSSPDDQALRMLYGQLLVEEEEFSSAREVFERLLTNRPKEPDVLFAVGILSLQLDDLDGARIYFTRLYETGQRRDDAAFYLGQVEERAEQAQAALDWYSKVEGANAVDAQIRIALLRAEAGEVTQAREILQRLRHQGPESAVVLYLVETEILESVGHTAAAMAVFDTALQAFPDDETLLYGRALLSVRLDQIPDAERDLRRIVDLDPEHADALNALGYTLADQTDRYQEAKGYIEKAYALKPDEPAILDSMGWVYYRLGELETARDYLQRALALSSDGEIAAHLGEVLWAMGRREEARSVWDEALAQEPDHPYLNEVVSRHRADNHGVTP